MKNLYIARPEQSLQEHLIGVSEKTKRFAAKIGLPLAGALIGLLHDFGKYSKKFQEYILRATNASDLDIDNGADTDNDNDKRKDYRGKIDHSTAGAQWIWKRLKESGAHNAERVCGQILALCIASHHSGLIDCLSEYTDFHKRMKKIDAETNYAECCANVDNAIILAADSLADQNLIIEMTEKLKLNDLEHNKTNQIFNFNLGLFARFLFSCLIDADRIDSAAVNNSLYLEVLNRKTDWDVAINRLEVDIDNFNKLGSIDAIRRKISDDCYKKAFAKQGIYTLTVPTGGGKTLASLRYALHHAKQHDLDRIIYIIPYTSIIEQNASAIRKIIEKETDKFPWVLEHHANLEPEKQTWHSKLVSDNWDASIVMTTMVQFLEVLFGRGTRGARRLHQFANSVLIFDEIQTLPIKCVRLFCNAINFLIDHTKTTVVLCTATQPLLTELKDPEKGLLVIPEDHELASQVEQLFIDLERVEIINCYKSGGWKESEIVDLILTEYRQKGNCLIIVNTKEWAQQLYKNLADGKMEKESLFHLSTNQYPAHRKAILAKIQDRLKSGLPVLCISTQLIEAGVDIDFSCVIRFLAGLDSIAQAAGRCNRHGNLKNATGEYIKGTVYIVNPNYESLDSLPDIKEGSRIAEDILRDSKGKSILIPEIMNQYFEKYLFNRINEMDYSVSPSKVHPKHDTLLNLLSTNPTCNKVTKQNDKLPLFRQAFMTAGKLFNVIDAPIQAIIIQHGEGKNIVAELCRVAKDFNPIAYHDLLKKSQEYTVNAFPAVWKKLLSQNAVYEIQGDGIYYLHESHYSEEFGLSTKPVAEMSNCVV